MARGYDPEVKAAVLAALLTGQSVTSVADEYNIPRGTVSSWKKREAEPIFLQAAATVATDATQKRESVATEGDEPTANVGPRIITYLEKSLDSLAAQADHFADKQWLDKQLAAEIAVLHGVQADKAIRLIEALNRASEPDGHAT